MTASTSRIVGSGFTTLLFGTTAIAAVESFTDSGQAIYGPAQATPVYSIGNRHADEIVTGRVLAPGTLSVVIREAWHESVWRNLIRAYGLTETQTSSAVDMLDALDLLDTITTPLTATMTITHPGGGHRGKVYNGLTLTSMDDGETVSVGALTLSRTITFMYVSTSILPSTA